MWQSVGAFLLLLMITVLILLRLRRSPWLAVGWFWFIGTLVPVIGLVQVGAQSIADRYTYFPLIGIFIMIAWGVPELLKGLRVGPRAAWGRVNAGDRCSRGPHVEAARFLGER